MTFRWVIRPLNLAIPDSESTWASSPDASLALPDPDRPRETLKAVPLYEQALEGYQRGCYEDAAQIVVSLLSQNENDAQAMLLLARVYANQGKLTAAITWCDKAIVVRQDDCMRSLSASHDLTGTRFAGRSRPLAPRAVYVDPRFALSHFALGSLALGRGELKESEKHFENVLLLLASYGPEETVPESEGLSARRLTEIVTLQRSQKTVAAVVAQVRHVRRARQRFQPWVGNSPLMEREHEMLEQKTGLIEAGGQAGQPIGPSSIAAWRPLDPPYSNDSVPVSNRGGPFCEREPGCWLRKRKGNKELFESPLEVVEFLLASEHYGIELTHIREIHALSKLTPLPGTPAFVMGLANVRGQILSVIDIKKFFGLPEKGLTDLNKVIVVRTQQWNSAFSLMLLLGVRAIGLSDLQNSLRH